MNRIKRIIIYSLYVFLASLFLLIGLIMMTLKETNACNEYSNNATVVNKPSVGVESALNFNESNNKNNNYLIN